MNEFYTIIGSIISVGAVGVFWILFLMAKDRKVLAEQNQKLQQHLISMDLYNRKADARLEKHLQVIGINSRHDV